MFTSSTRSSNFDMAFRAGGFSRVHHVAHLLSASAMMLIIITLLGAADAQQADIPGMPPGCKDGVCPTPAATANSNGGEDTCGLWLGPSPIKQAEEHGFGLGMFTGKPIKAGHTVEGTFYGENGQVDGEILLALFGSTEIHSEHPPLREYIWDEMNYPEVPLEYPHDETAMFLPGLASIAPCTSKNYNLKVARSGTEKSGSIPNDAMGVHRASASGTAGSFSYRTVAYQATRDIFPGEELVVQCGDDDFDGGAYYLTRFDVSDNAVTCLDHVQVQKVNNIGRGLAARKALSAGSLILSTPVVPVHRREMNIADTDINSKQQMLNYCYGDPDSDLLLLPFGPLANYINHGDTPNAAVRWHKAKSDHESMERRLQYHHEELFESSAEAVALTHGKGLVLDIVALKDIVPGEPILLDYGEQWREAWKRHQDTWIGHHVNDKEYQSASDYLKVTDDNDRVRTSAEQLAEPYPPNTEVFCFYRLFNHDMPEYSQAPEFTKKEHGVNYFKWDDTVVHECFRPCTILERHVTTTGPEDRYMVQLSQMDNIRIIDWCIIDAPYIIENYPAHAIRIVDSPYTTDEFLKDSFRQEIGLPPDMYPPAWRRTKLRKKKSSGDADGDEFKRRSATQFGPKPKRGAV